MKKLFLLLWLLVPTLLVKTTYAHDYDTSKNCLSLEEEKFYPIHYEDIEINREGIFLNYHGNWIQIRSLFQDSSGRWLGSTNEWSFTWSCPKCHHENSAFRNECAKCGYRPAADG